MSTVGGGGDSLLVFHTPREGAALGEILALPPSLPISALLDVDIPNWRCGWVGSGSGKKNLDRTNDEQECSCLSLLLENEQLLITCEINEFQFERTDTHGRTDQEK